MESFVASTPTEIVRSELTLVDDETNSKVNSELTLVDSGHEPFYLDRAPDCINKEVNDWFNLNQRLKYYWILEGLTRTSWGLTKEEIRELTDCNVRGDRYEYDCFVFVRSSKVKGKNTWRVKRKS